MPAYILTGTPGSGKTALLRALEVRGHSVVEEAATDVIALDQALGVATPWTDPSFLDRILALQLRRAPSAEFVDRSPVCTLALARFLGFPPSVALTTAAADAVAAYSPSVFFVRHRSAIERTPGRQISLAEALDFERVHEQTYRELGFTLVDVPDGPLADRVRAVEAAMADRG
ncbi:AAA family ATPase [Acidothermaceae bacterium B102]|nr:AAA family ATPase [Acidothermaceae bacterium B102]